jgi:hypothetical protein
MANEVYEWSWNNAGEAGGRNTYIGTNQPMGWGDANANGNRRPMESPIAPFGVGATPSLSQGAGMYRNNSAGSMLQPMSPTNFRQPGNTTSLGGVTPSRIGISDAERNAQQLANSLMTGQYGNFNRLLSGRPDMGLLEQAVLSPSRRNLQNTVIPGIEDQFSGGPYGGSYNTGARREAVSNAYNAEADFRARAMFDQTALSQQMGLQAAQALSGLANVGGISTRNEQTNRDNDMQAQTTNLQARYQQAQLNEAAYNRAIQASTLALQQAGMRWNQQNSLNQQAQSGSMLSQSSGSSALSAAADPFAAVRANVAASAASWVPGSASGVRPSTTSRL